MTHENTTEMKAFIIIGNSTRTWRFRESVANELFKETLALDPNTTMSEGYVRYNDDDRDDFEIIELNADEKFVADQLYAFEEENGENPMEYQPHASPDPDEIVAYFVDKGTLTADDGKEILEDYDEAFQFYYGEHPLTQEYDTRFESTEMAKMIASKPEWLQNFKENFEI